MTSDGWVPFGLDEDEESQYLVLVDGIPTWSKAELMRWMATQLAGPTAFIETATDMAKALKLQTRTRVHLGRDGQPFPSNQLDELIRVIASKDDQVILRLIDGILATQSLMPTYDPAKRLNAVLDSAQSKWRAAIRIGTPGLVARVPEGVQNFTESVITRHLEPGKLLARAWAKLHALEPDATGAYRDAVRATEIAVIAIVQPNNQKATLGSALGQMKADGNWRLPLVRPSSSFPSEDVIRAMWSTLWEGQHDRHGKPIANLDVSLEEARISVGIASACIDWFASGLIRRSP